MTSTSQEMYIAELLFLSKVLGMWIVFLLVRMGWEKIIRFVSSKTFFSEFLAPSDDRGLVQSWCRYVWQECSRRTWLLCLGLSSLHGRLFLLLQAVVIYQLGMQGLLNDLSPVIRAESPDPWIFFLGDPSLFNVTVILLIGAVLTFLFVRPLLVSTIALILVFNGVLSLAAALAMLAAERLAIRTMFFASFRSRVKMTDILPVWVVSLGTVLFAVFWARDFFLSWGEVLGLLSFKPWDRFVLLGVGVVLVSVVEVFLLLGFYHFYFQRTGDEKAVEAFPPRQLLWAGWVSRDLKNVILARAIARFEALQKMDRDLEADNMRSQLPSALLMRMQKEKRELRKLLKA